MPLATRGWMWIQQHRAPPRVGTDVTEYVNEDNQGRLIGRSGLVAWPPRSPNWNPFDYFLLDCIGPTPKSRQQLAQCLVENATQDTKWIVFSGGMYTVIRSNVSSSRTDEVIFYSSFNLGARWERVVKTMPRPLYPWEKDRAPHVQETAWVPGAVWTVAESLLSPRTWVLNESLYRLRNPGPQSVTWWSFRNHIWLYLLTLIARLTAKISSTQCYNTPSANPTMDL